MTNIMRLGGGSGGVGLNIEYGPLPPTDTSKLWVPLAKKPDNVEISGDSLQSAVDTVELSLVSLNNETSRHCAVEINGRIYSFGSTSEYVEVFDPAAGTCTLTTAKPPSYSCENACAVAINGKAYIFGGPSNIGNSRKRVLMYDPETDKFTNKGDLLPRYATNVSAAAIGGKAYVFGGYDADGGTTYDTIAEYDPETNTVRTMGAKLSTAKSYTGATAINGRAYIFGSNSSSTQAVIEEYNPATDTITVKNATLQKGCSRPVVVAINGKAYILAGSAGSGGNADIQEYDPAADVCVKRNTVLPNAVYDACGAVVGDTVYVLGSHSTLTYKKIQVYTPNAYLGANNLKCFASVYRKSTYQIPTNLVDSKTAQIKLYMTSAFLGDDAGYATEQKAYVYNDAKGVWQDLNGTVKT